MKKLLLLMMTVIVFISGCAYSTKSLVPLDAKSIYIPIFKNDTYKPSKTRKTFKKDIENVVTDDVIDRFLEDGSLRVLNKENADIMLVGEVNYYSKTPLRYSSVDMDTVDEYRINIRVKLKLIDLRTDDVIWENEVISRENDYYVRGASISTEDSALAQASLELAKDILIQVVEAW